MTFVRLFTLLAMLGLLGTAAGISAEKDPEPPKLTELRASWAKACERDSLPVKQSYLTTLEELRDNLTRGGKLKEALGVSVEITKVKGEAHLEETKEPTTENNPALDLLRGKYQLQLATALRNNNAIYRNALESLKSTFAKAADLNAALAVKAELARLDGGSPAAAPSDLPAIADASLPQTTRQLTNFLENTRWTAPGITFDFFKDGTMKMPWGPSLWQAVDKRQATMIHPKNAWRKRMEFSENMKQIKVFDGSGMKSKWEATFASKLDEKGNPVPAKNSGK